MPHAPSLPLFARSLRQLRLAKSYWLRTPYYMTPDSPHPRSLSALFPLLPAPDCSLRQLRLEKSYWLRLEDRWSRASLRSIARLQRDRPDLQVDYQHMPGGLRLTW